MMRHIKVNILLNIFALLCIVASAAAQNLPTSGLHSVVIHCETDLAAEDDSVQLALVPARAVLGRFYLYCDTTTANLDSVHVVRDDGTVLLSIAMAEGPEQGEISISDLDATTGESERTYWLRCINNALVPSLGQIRVILEAQPLY